MVDADVVDVVVVAAGVLAVLLELAFVFDDELEELPHALIAMTATNESNVAKASRVRLLKTAPPPRGLMMRPMYSVLAPRWRTSPRNLIIPQHATGSIGPVEQDPWAGSGHREGVRFAAAVAPDSGVTAPNLRVHM